MLSFATLAKLCGSAWRLGAFAVRPFLSPRRKGAKKTFPVCDRRIQVLRRLLALFVLSIAGAAIFARHQTLNKVPAGDIEPVSTVNSRVSPQTQALISREQEIELALKAGPVHLRNEAS